MGWILVDATMSMLSCDYGWECRGDVSAGPAEENKGTEGKTGGANVVSGSRVLHGVIFQVEPTIVNMGSC